MEKVINNNKIGKIFMYIASIFLIVASTASLVLLLVDRIPDVLLILGGTGMGATIYMDLFALVIPIVFALIQLIISIVCVVKNKKHGSIKIATTISLISFTYVLMYLFLTAYSIPSSLIGSNISGSSSILNLLNIAELVFPILFFIVCSILFGKIKRNSKKAQKPVFNKILSVALILVTIIFLLVEIDARIAALGAGLFAKIVFILSMVSLSLFFIEGIVSIVYLILNRASLHTNVNQNLECELVKEEANYKLEKRYLERGNKSTSTLVLSILFACFIGATLIWELISYIPRVSDSFDFANTVTGDAKLEASIMVLYRSVMLFLLVGLIAYFIYGAVCFILGQKGKYFKLNNFLLFQGLFVLFAHFVPVVYDTIELMGFAFTNPIILLPIITTAVFIILSIVSLVFASKAKQLKNGTRNSQLIKALAISNTVLMSGIILMFIVACIYTLSLQYIPAIIGVILLCVTFWLQVKNPREEYFLVKTEIQQTEVKEEPQQIEENA